MKLIVGLGNPEERYDNTRHNIGFVFVDLLQNRWNFPPFTYNKKCHAHITQHRTSNSTTVMLAKPDTYMNHSGRAVQAIVHFYDIDPCDVVVVHDDLDICIGHYKHTTGGSAAGHNGVQSVIDCLGTPDFARLRIGIENADGRHARTISGKDFVLQPFTRAEHTIIHDTLDTIITDTMQKPLS